MTLELEREDVVQRLCAAYARDKLTTGELESRLEKAYQSSDRATLLTVLDGLPAVQIERIGEQASMLPAAVNRAPVTPVRHTPTGLPAGLKRYGVYFSSLKKEGAWTPAPRIESRVYAATLVLDFREVAIPADGIDIDLDVLMGEARILLPPGLGAEVDCSSFMSEVRDKSKPALPGAPTIRVTGSAIMGTIVVQTKVPPKEGEDGLRAQMRRWLTGEG